MRFWIALVGGIACGLVGSWLWRLGLICAGHRFFPVAFRTYDADLATGRINQREQLTASRATSPYRKHATRQTLKTSS